MRRLPANLKRCILAMVMMLTADAAKACGFAQVLEGICPSERTEAELLAMGAVDRATVLDFYNWSRYPDFRRSRSIALQVCIFRRPTKTVAPWRGATTDFSAHPQLFERVGSTIESAAAQWASSSGKTLAGERVVSRLQFRFRGSQGEIQACEEHLAPHILVAINQQNTNFSEIGFAGLQAALSGHSRKATMTLGMSSRGDMASDVIMHEFGHSLGYLHEMAHEDWDGCADAFMADAYIDSGNVTFGRGYTRDEAIALAARNIQELGKAYRNLAVFSERFDRKSIMTYRIPEQFFNPVIKAAHGMTSCGVDQTIRQLSSTDRSMFLGYYGSQ